MAMVSSMVWLTPAEVDAVGRAVLVDNLTIAPRPRRTVALETIDGVDKKVWRTEEDGGPIETFIERDGLFGVPIHYGSRLPFGTFHDEGMSDGAEIEVARLPDPTSPRAPAGQDIFFKAMVLAMRDNYAVLACAPTGAGKTVAVLNAIGNLKRTALIIVPTTVLAQQWRNEAMLHLGLEAGDIGFVQGGASNWKGKKIVIAVIHNLFLKKYSDRFYRYFGIVAWDEAHKLGAREFSKTMTLFPAAYKLAVTATPGRKDGLDALVHNYFGAPCVVAEAPALAATCWRVPFPLIGKLQWIERCRNDVRPMKWLAGLSVRNELIVRMILKLHAKGRVILVLSRFIDHLETLGKMLRAAGVPDEAIGQFTGSYGSKGKKVGKPYLDHVRANSQIILATYAMAKEGMDIPRLDTGIEATPVADNIQGIGRIRRPLPGKRSPLWFSIEDLNVSLFVRYSASRFRGFESVNVTIKKLTEGMI